MPIFVTQRKKIYRQFAQFTLLILICLGFVGQGCPLMDILLDITSTVKEQKKAGETFDVIVADFETRGEEIWFNESNIAKKLRDAIAEGVAMAQEREPSIRLLGILSGSYADPIYIGLKSRTEGDRKTALSAVVEKYGGNAIIFGIYEGDDYSITIKPYIYSTEREAIGKGGRTTFKRVDPDFERKIAILIKDLVLKIFRG